jgi:hypothetical protein
MVPEFASAAFAQESGTVSATPVRTKFGFHVIKVTDKKPAGTATFEEAKNQIGEFLRTQKQRQFLKSLVNEKGEIKDSQHTQNKDNTNYKYVLVGPKIKGISLGMRFQDAIDALKNKLEGKKSLIANIPYELVGPFDSNEGPLAEMNKTVEEISHTSISTPYVTTLPPISDTAGAFAGGLIMRADKNNAVYLLTITGPLTKVLFDGATSLSYQDFVKEFMNAYGIPEFKPNTEGNGYEYRYDNGVIISIAKDYTLQLEKAQSKEEIKSSFD